MDRLLHDIPRFTTYTLMKNNYRKRSLLKFSPFSILRLLLFILGSSYGISPAICQEITSLDRTIQSLYVLGGFNYAFHDEFPPVHAGGGIVFKSDWGFEIIYTVQYFEANNKPADYQSGLCLFKPCVPQGINSWSLPLSKSFKFADQNFRLKLGVGPALFMYQEPLYRKRSPSGGFFSSNYEVTYKEHHLPGLFCQFRGEFMPRSFVGLGFGISVKLNSEISYLSLDLSLPLGIMRTSPKRWISL